MDVRRRLLPVLLFGGLVPALLLCSGCVSDEVVYVDERGNELAIDPEGRPVLPAHAPGVVEEAPYAPEGHAAAASALPVRPSARPPAAATPVSDEDLPPAGPVGTPIEVPPTAPRASDVSPAPKGAPEPATEPKVPPKKIDSSSALDRPPAG